MRIEIATLLRLLEIDDEVRHCGPDLWKELAKHVDAVLDRFYVNLKSFEVSALVPDPILGELKRKQREHWAALFGSNFSRDYAARVARIAKRHREIKLSPFWHVAGYLQLKSAFGGVIEKEALPPITKRRYLRALDKYIFFDIALTLVSHEAAASMSAHPDRRV